MLHLLIWLRLCLSGFPKISIFTPFPYMLIRKRSLTYRPYWRGRELCGCVDTQIIWIFLPRRYVYSSSVYLHQYVVMDSKLRVTIQYYFIFLLKLYPALAMETHSISYCFPLTHPHRYGAFISILNTSVLSDTKRCSRLLLYISCSSPRISHLARAKFFLIFLTLKYSKNKRTVEWIIRNTPFQCCAGAGSHSP